MKKGLNCSKPKHEDVGKPRLASPESKTCTLLHTVSAVLGIRSKSAGP